MTREELRKELINLKENQGMTYAFMAGQLKVNRNNITYFIKDQRPLSDRLAYELETKIVNRFKL